MCSKCLPHVLSLLRWSFFPASADDRGVLVDIYGALRGDDWKRKDHWVTSSEIGKWYGVTVENGKVVKLDLTRNNVQGKLPGAIGQLRHLRELRLARNKLTGNLPNTFEHLGVLTILDCAWNDIRGLIPPNMGKCKSLRRLKLEHNHLSGTIPPSLGALANLEELSMHDNDLSGNIPQTVCALLPSSSSSPLYITPYLLLIDWPAPIPCDSSLA